MNRRQFCFSLPALIGVIKEVSEYKPVHDVERFKIREPHKFQRMVQREELMGLLHEKLIRLMESYLYKPMTFEFCKELEYRMSWMIQEEWQFPIDLLVEADPERGCLLVSIPDTNSNRPFLLYLERGNPHRLSQVSYT